MSVCEHMRGRGYELALIPLSAAFSLCVALSPRVSLCSSTIRGDQCRHTCASGSVLGYAVARVREKLGGWAGGRARAWVRGCVDACVGARARAVYEHVPARVRVAHVSDVPTSTRTRTSACAQAGALIIHLDNYAAHSRCKLARWAPEQCLQPCVL